MRQFIPWPSLTIIVEIMGSEGEETIIDTKRSDTLAGFGGKEPKYVKGIVCIRAIYQCAVFSLCLNTSRFGPREEQRKH